MLTPDTAGMINTVHRWLAGVHAQKNDVGAHHQSDGARVRSVNSRYIGASEALIRLIKSTALKKTLDWLFLRGCVDFMLSLSSSYILI